MYKTCLCSDEDRNQRLSCCGKTSLTTVLLSELVFGLFIRLFLNPMVLCHLVFFLVAAPAAPGEPDPALSHHVQPQWSGLELCTPGSLPSCAITHPLCPLPSLAHHLRRSSLHTPLSRIQPCLLTQPPTPLLSWRRLGAGWRRSGGGTHYSKPSRGVYSQVLGKSLIVF